MKNYILPITLLLCPIALCAWNNTSNPYTFSGKVGIGTQSPGGELHIKAPSPELRIQSTAENDPVTKYYSNSGSHWDTRYDVSLNRFNIRYSDSSELFIESNGDTTVQGFMKSATGRFYFGENMRFYRAIDPELVYVSDDANESRISFKNGLNQRVGSIHGENYSGKLFGLYDAQMRWAVQVADGEHVSFHVAGSEKMKVEADFITVSENMSISSDVTISGELSVARVPPQGDVLMGDFTE